MRVSRWDLPRSSEIVRYRGALDGSSFDLSVFARFRRCVGASTCHLIAVMFRSRLEYFAVHSWLCHVTLISSRVSYSIEPTCEGALHG